LSSSRRILDLSKDIPTAEDWNTSKASVELQNVIQSQFPQVLSYVVVDNGLKVAEFYDSATGKVNETTLQHAFSVTKSWTSLLIGILQFMNKISVKETLENIWKDENNSIWPLVNNSNFRKNITVEELLTMTSGCDDPPIDVNASRYSLEEGTHAGINLIEVLNYPTCNSSQKGFFNYMNDNILSYVILERSGMRPQQFAGKYLMPYLGMTNTTWEWLKNLDGVAYASAGLSTTTLNYAKFGLLYLQNGFASDGKQIISKAWIDNSTVSHFVPKELPQGWFHVNQSTAVSYGYRFWLFDNRTYCAYGAGGHYVCIWNDLNRVLAVNVAFPSFNYSAWLGYSFVQIVGDTEWATGGEKEKEASSSSSLLHTIQVSLTCVIVTLLYMI
jgi:CubicO group peptidase (beta-lactamase class C family)